MSCGLSRSTSTTVKIAVADVSEQRDRDVHRAMSACVSAMHSTAKSARRRRSGKQRQPGWLRAGEIGRAAPAQTAAVFRGLPRRKWRRPVRRRWPAPRFAPVRRRRPAAVNSKNRVGASASVVLLNRLMARSATARRAVRCGHRHAELDGLDHRLHGGRRCSEEYTAAEIASGSGVELDRQLGHDAQRAFRNRPAGRVVSRPTTCGRSRRFS